MDDSNEFYCECGQCLHIYFNTIKTVCTKRPLFISGLPCPANGCEKTYSIEAKLEESQEQDKDC